ncbi:MAG: hypothetical protein ACYCQI_09685 [Gammaproteobacteria bacterium]
MLYAQIFKKTVLFFLTVIALFLAGCNADKVYYQTENNVADVVDRQKDAIRKSDAAAKPQPPLIVDQGLYVDKTPISLAKQPPWLHNHIVMRGDELPFSYYSRTVANGGGSHILTRYQVGLDPTIKVSVNYSGTVKGALDLISAKTGYVYSINGCNVYWQAFVTRTFDIAFMPGVADYQMGKAGGGGASAPSSAGAGQTVNAMIDDSSASQFSNLKGSLSVWKDLENTIKQLLSPEGKVMVSESTTTVTVRDRATNVDLVGKFISNFNHNLSKQVLVKVQVLDISLSNAYNYGIDWTAVKHTLGSNFILNANYGTPISISNLAPFATTTPFGAAAGSAAGLPQLGVINPGHSTGVTALINALTQQGKVSIVTEPRVVCLNNQVSAVRIVNQQGYLASVQNTTVAGAAGGGSAGTITSQITPGTVITGLTLYILPKIMGEKIFLQVNVDLSTLVSIQTISSGSLASTTNSPTIQTPQLTQKQFNQRSVVGSNDTMIISGFKSVQNTANAMQLLESQALGGKASTQNNVETIVLITPIILHGYV